MMRSPAFPPRRPSHLVRYIVPVAVLLCLFYYLSITSRDGIPVKYGTETGTGTGAGAGAGIVHQGQGSSDGPETLDQDVKPPEKGTLTGPESPGQIEKPPVKGGSAGKKPDDDEDAKPVKLTPGSDPKIEQGQKPESGSSGANRPPSPPPPTKKHPIDDLIALADGYYNEVLDKESKTLTEAADAYRKRRGRHPPPGFDAWYQFAVERKAVMVEDFFDQIYHDLNPFWGLEPDRIRKEAVDYEMTINIRNHTATAESDWFWTQIWLNMTQTIEHLLPDMDIALNAMDEPRLVIPWETIDKYMAKEKKTRKLTPPKKVISEFQELPSPKEMKKLGPATRDKDWEDSGMNKTPHCLIPRSHAIFVRRGYSSMLINIFCVDPYWDIARRGCPPSSLARKEPLLETYDKPPNFKSTLATPHQYNGYVSNYTLSTDFCHQPDLQGLEGIFIQPLSTAATKVFFPMFGGSKLATNNEILLPAPMYWNEEERFTGGNDHGAHWDRKTSSVIWRGVATGGKNNETNWKGFQRHRFVSMANGTKLARAEEKTVLPVNFELPSTSYDLAAQKEGRLGEWVSQWTDVGFTDLFCREDYKPEPEKGHCPYTEDHFEIVLGQSMSVQFGYKYLPDIDGNSFSGRYLGFLRSTSLPIKSTLWREWHDSRLVAWKHFVPMDNRFGDFYGIMEYFLGYEDRVAGHDAEAEKIASDGKAWAEKVLRKEDMQIYVLRLLLEYARIVDDNRESMGWVDDLR